MAEAWPFFGEIPGRLTEKMADMKIVGILLCNRRCMTKCWKKCSLAATMCLKEVTARILKDDIQCLKGLS